MAIKTYKDPEVQDFMKSGTGNLRFGEQYAATYKLPIIYDAHEISETATAITSITAVKIGSKSSYNYGIEEISRTSLSVNLIDYDSTTEQYITDTDLLLASLLDECIYYLEFQNGHNLFKTDAFLVQEMTFLIRADNTLKTADNTVYTTDQTHFTI